VFLGYKRSSQAPNGPDDWMEMSGHARGGDSGGPIFNANGRVVGVLWGTDGEHVVGVQAGRIHLLLEEALPQVVEQKAFVLLGIFERKPTPPLAGPSSRVQPTAPRASSASQGNSVQQESLGQIIGRKPIPQSPQIIVQSDPELRQSLGNIDAKIGVLVQDRQAVFSQKHQALFWIILQSFHIFLHGEPVILNVSFRCLRIMVLCKRTKWTFFG
jgi:hypothetical protein